MSDQLAANIDRPYVEFSDDEVALPLYRAAQWVALKGASGWLSLEEIEQAATSELFPAMARGKLVAHCLLAATCEPETVPAGRWALITTRPDKAGQFLDWINSWLLENTAIQAGQFGGELTRMEDRSATTNLFGGRPKWINITINLEDLKRVFGTVGRDGSIAAAAGSLPLSAKVIPRPSASASSHRTRGSRVDDARALIACRELIMRKGPAWKLRDLSPQWQAAEEVGFANNPNDADAARRDAKRLSIKLKNGKSA